MARRGHGAGRGGSFLLPASVVGAEGGRLARRGLGRPGTWVSGHLKRERERDKNQAERAERHITRTCPADGGVPSNENSLEEAKAPSESGPLSDTVYFRAICPAVTSQYNVTFPPTNVVTRTGSSHTLLMPAAAAH